MCGHLCDARLRLLSLLSRPGVRMCELSEPDLNSVDSSESGLRSVASCANEAAVVTCDLGSTVLLDRGSSRERMGIPT